MNRIVKIIFFASVGLSLPANQSELLLAFGLTQAVEAHQANPEQLDHLQDIVGLYCQLSKVSRQSARTILEKYKLSIDQILALYYQMSPTAPQDVLEKYKLEVHDIENHVFSSDDENIDFEDDGELQKAVDLSEELSIPQGMKGLSNRKPGNRCFLNALLQSLAVMDDLVIRMLHPEAQKLHTPHSLSKLTIACLQDMKMHDTKILDPQMLAYMVWNKMKVEPETQQDAGEAAQVIFQHLCETDLIDSKSKEPFSELLNTTIKSSLVKGNQETATTTSEPILNISMQKDDTTLKQCLDTYFAPELLVDSNEHIKTNMICKTSKYLMIAVKRTQFVVGKKNHKEKNQNPLTFELTNLNLNDYSDYNTKLPLYDLIATIFHSGGAEGGHYTAYVNANGTWYSCNDRRVEALNAAQMDEIASRGHADEAQTSLPAIFIYQAQR